jgi:hypothetical protein
MEAKKIGLVGFFVAAIVVAAIYYQPHLKTDDENKHEVALSAAIETPFSDEQQADTQWPGVAADAPIPADNSCEEVPYYFTNADGGVTMTWRCLERAQQKTHPYNDYTNATLATLVYSDADAAEILGMRLRERDEKNAMRLAIRASALSGGETQAIKNYVNAYPAPTFTNGVPNPRTIHTKYVLSAVIDLLGDPASGVEAWERLVRDNSPTPERTVTYLNGKARQIVDEMRRIELDVAGQSTIAGDDDD